MGLAVWVPREILANGRGRSSDCSEIDWYLPYLPYDSLIPFLLVDRLVKGFSHTGEVLSINWQRYNDAVLMLRRILASYLISRE